MTLNKYNCHTKDKKVAIKYKLIEQQVNEAAFVCQIITSSCSGNWRPLHQGHTNV
jgi:hypothetical protein